MAKNINYKFKTDLVSNLWITQPPQRDLRGCIPLPGPVPVMRGLSWFIWPGWLELPGGLGISIIAIQVNKIDVIEMQSKLSYLNFLSLNKTLYCKKKKQKFRYYFFLKTSVKVFFSKKKTTHLICLNEGNLNVFYNKAKLSN